ncbi:glycosyltransferase [Microbacterium sp. H37-C3]|uniref:glycosyltransferase n=1 Tax=Microbacterium sp. H37-C3 TaxID=3004354 RepID=UPI0022AFDE3B|nr:glycosyltransferase [Microbacterium sp. H37-C3]MCZ4068374.1 glycosyltransferase [Microbacterium sp. H37-C3]
MAIIGTRGYPSFYGGFETAVRRLAPYLADRGWAVTVYGRRGATEPEVADRRVTQIESWGIERQSLSTLSYGLSSAMHARSVRPSVALVMNVANGYWLPLLKQARVPTVVNVDGIEWERDKWGRLAKTVFLNGARATARHGDVLVYDSQVIGARWRSQFGRDGNFIPYGGDTMTSDPAVPLGLDRRKYALLVARFVPENTVPAFIEAAKSIADSHPVVLVGSSGYGGALDAAAATAAQHPNVKWLGHLKDDSLLHALWYHAGAYFHGHSVGGTNPALVQAMACGAPTVARDTEFNREVLRHAGHYVKPQPRDISQAITDLLDRPAEQDRLSAAARQRALSHYSWEGVCDSYERTLLEAIAHGANEAPARDARSGAK